MRARARGEQRQNKKRSGAKKPSFRQLTLLVLYSLLGGEDSLVYWNTRGSTRGWLSHTALHRSLAFLELSLRLNRSTSSVCGGVVWLPSAAKESKRSSSSGYGLYPPAGVSVESILSCMVPVSRTTSRLHPGSCDMRWRREENASCNEDTSRDYCPGFEEESTVLAARPPLGLSFSSNRTSSWSTSSFRSSTDQLAIYEDLPSCSY